MLDNIKYIRSNIQFKKILDILNISFKEYYDIHFLREIKNFAKEISEYDMKMLSGEKIDDSTLKEVFTSSLANIGNSDIYDYYRSRIMTIYITRNRNLKNGDANLNIIVSRNSLYAECINLPYYARTVDLLSLAHEMGHIPCYENKRKDISEYFEYTEVLPMMLEYFMCSYIFKDDEKIAILKERLPLERQAAISFCKKYKLYNELPKKSSADKRKYLLYDLIEAYKYLASLDFSLQLIDIMDTDKKEVINSLADVVIGDSSIKDVGEKFNIDTKYCKRLVKEYKK